MVRRTYDADGAGAGGATNQFWAYDEGINAVLQFDGASASNLAHRYLWSDQVDDLFADEQVTSLSSGGNTLWALSDHLGSIRDIADYNEATGVTTVANHRTLSATGKIISETNAAVDLLFAFTGKQFDDATGLQHNLFRWYDAGLGKWLSEDPIGFTAGDENLTRYVSGQATQHVDHNGLYLEVPMAFFAGMGQGGLNIGNGITDAAIGIGNLGIALPNSIAGGIDYLTGNNLPHNQIRIPYIPRPDWSRDLITYETDSDHGWSKFGGQMVFFAATALPSTGAWYASVPGRATVQWLPFTTAPFHVVFRASNGGVKGPWIHWYLPGRNAPPLCEMLPPVYCPATTRTWASFLTSIDIPVRNPALTYLTTYGQGSLYSNCWWTAIYGIGWAL